MQRLARITVMSEVFSRAAHTDYRLSIHCAGVSAERPRGDATTPRGLALQISTRIGQTRTVVPVSTWFASRLGGDMASEDDLDRENIVITSLSAQVHEELLLLSQSEGAPADDDDIEVVEYEVSLNSLHRAIHVVTDSATSIEQVPIRDA